MPRSAIPAVERVLTAFLALPESEQATVILTARLIKERSGPVKKVKVPAAVPVVVAPKVTQAPKPAAAPVLREPRRRRRPMPVAAVPSAPFPIEAEAEVVGLEAPDAAPEPAE